MKSVSRQSSQTSTADVIIVSPNVTPSALNAGVGTADKQIVMTQHVQIVPVPQVDDTGLPRTQALASK